MRLLAVCVLAARTQARVALVAAPCIRLGSTPVRGPRAWQELSGRAFGWRVSFVPHIERSCLHVKILCASALAQLELLGTHR